jgi:hypothetical protein
MDDWNDGGDPGAQADYMPAGDDFTVSGGESQSRTIPRLSRVAGKGSERGSETVASVAPLPGAGHMAVERCTQLTESPLPLSPPPPTRSSFAPPLPSRRVSSQTILRCVWLPGQAV